jgi:hypothetical protein
MSDAALKLATASNYLLHKLATPEERHAAEQVMAGLTPQLERLCSVLDSASFDALVDGALDSISSASDEAANLIDEAASMTDAMPRQQVSMEAVLFVGVTAGAMASIGSARAVALVIAARLQEIVREPDGTVSAKFYKGISAEATEINRQIGMTTSLDSLVRKLKGNAIDSPAADTSSEVDADQ